MQLSNLPARIAAIFAASAAPGYRNTIPLTQSGIAQPGQASYDVGFPSVTMQPAASGGINPYGQDFNGLGFALTAVQQWQSAGGTFPFDSTFSTAIGGYPKGAVLINAAGDGFWLNLTDNNTSNPDTGGSNWAPLDGYGITAVTGLTNSNVTLTATQYSKRIITLAGTLTGNVQIIFPTTLQQWMVVNNTTGAFTITCKTAAGSGSTVPQGGLQAFWGDGANLNQGAGDARYQLAGSISQSSIQGAAKNLVVSTAGTSAPVTVTADEITVESAANTYQTLRSVSVTPSLAVSGANGLDTGTSAANTWYSVWVIWNGSTVAGLLSLSATSPTMPSGYTHKARVGWIRSDGTANKFPLAFQQYGRSVRYKVAAGTNVTGLPIMVSGAQGSISTPTYVSVAVGTFIPPTAAAIAFTSVGMGATGQVVIVAPSNTYGAYTSTTNPPPYVSSVGAGGAGQSHQPYVMYLESTNIFVAISSTCGIACLGWEDNS